MAERNYERLKDSQIELIRNLLDGFDKDGVFASLRGPHGRKVWANFVGLLRLAGLEDHELQRELGVSLGAIHRWLTGDTMPVPGTRSAMVRASLKLLKMKLPC